MQIKVNNKDVNLNFGVRFIRELDRKNGMTLDIKGVEQNFGMALTKAVPALRSYDVAVLADLLYCAAWDNRERPSQSDIDAYLDDEKTNIDKLIDDITKELKSSNAAQKKKKNLKAQIVKGTTRLAKKHIA